MMKKGSVFANRKGLLSGTGFGTPVNLSSASTSFFDNSLPHMPPNALGNSVRNWQTTPMSSHRFPPSSGAIVNTPTSNMINRVKPYSLQNLVENLNELLAELAIPHSLRYENKYGFEDILTVLDVSHSWFRSKKRSGIR